MKLFTIAFLVYGDMASDRNALTEEKYKDLASAFLSEGFHVQSVLYNDESGDNLFHDLLHFDAILVWVNPIEQGNDRRKLDSLLVKLSQEGCFVSTHPEVILKIGTKDVLYKTNNIGWGSETKMYVGYEDFVARFPESLQQSGIKVLKQYRGNGGNGVYKIIKGSAANEVIVIHAKNSLEARAISWDAFFAEFKPYFFNSSLLIEQEWNANLINGMVRCYLSGNKVAGFGYQEINALYELNNNYFPPSKRYYFTENCGLFGDLKQIMENHWVPQLQQDQSITNERMPVIWDADFFINQTNSNRALGKYSLCEINVSSVSPFPPSAVPFIVNEVRNRLQQRQGSTTLLSGGQQFS
jgi:hypothetical protein